MVLCRFRVTEVALLGYSTRVKLQAMYDAPDKAPPEVVEEIRRFYDATPSGILEMQIKNDAAAEHFQPNDEWYIKLEKVPAGK